MQRARSDPGPRHPAMQHTHSNRGCRSPARRRAATARPCNTHSEQPRVLPSWTLAIAIATTVAARAIAVAIATQHSQRPAPRFKTGPGRLRVSRFAWRP
eukprot:8348525-Alexandrium_andersonii.AAC.1